jgi:mono/diheme cytochrome c family protein
MNKNPKVEIRNPNEDRNPKPEIRKTFAFRRHTMSRGSSRPFRTSDFGFLSAFGLRASDFRRRRYWRTILYLALTAAAAAGCRRDMFQQPYSKPLATSDFFREDSMASRPLVAHTVARGHLNADTAFYTGKIGTNLVDTFPAPVTRETLQRGRERFDIYCAPCHGRTGEGHGMIVQRGYPAPPSYHIDRLRQAPVGHFFDVMTQGYGVMYSYAQRVSPEDRWAIAAYIRVLQQSQDARISDVPVDQRAALERAQ